MAHRFRTLSPYSLYFFFRFGLFGSNKPLGNVCHDRDSSQLFLKTTTYGIHFKILLKKEDLYSKNKTFLVPKLARCHSLNERI